MEELNLAVTRIQASIKAAEAKIDALKAGAISEEQLKPLADALNAAADVLDAKVAE